MEELGYVKGVTDPYDRRVRRLFLTKKAGAIIKVLSDAKRRLDEIRTANLDEREVALAHELFRKMAENMISHMEAPAKDKRARVCR